MFSFQNWVYWIQIVLPNRTFANTQKSPFTENINKNKIKTKINKINKKYH